MVVGAIKTVIIGANGMLGFDLCKVFPDAVKLTHRELDITDRKQVLESILNLKPDVVINAAAYILFFRAFKNLYISAQTMFLKALKKSM